MSQRETLTHWITSAVKKRLRMNIRLRHLDDIEVRFTREELREYTGASRIENNTIAQIKGAIIREGWEVTGADNDQRWKITVRVRDQLSAFGSINTLREMNTRHGGMLLGQSAKRPATTPVEAS